MSKVLFTGGKAFIGANHGKAITLSDADEKKVKALAAKGGVWYRS